MAHHPRTYWKGHEELEAGEPLEARSELGPAPTAEELAVDRRNFLKVAGFTLGVGALAGCQRAPLEKAIPYLSATEEITPGRAYWIASTCGACSAGCGVLVKCRDGRPIKIEGNPEHPISRGGLCAIGQASLLELYDSRRPRGPLAKGTTATWPEIDASIREALGVADGARVRILTGTVNSPSTIAAIDAFVAAHPGARHDQYDALSSSAILDAHEATHGARLLPRYRFDRADVILSVDADFLGTWISPVEHTAAWASKRRPAGAPPSMSWHVQLEPRMSVTGSKADERHRILPAEASVVLRAILARLEGTRADAKLPIAAAALDRIVERLSAHGGSSLVVSGSQRVPDQIAVNLINEHLGNYGATVDLAQPSRQRLGSDRAIARLIDELRATNVDVLIVAGANPVYDFAAQGELERLFRSVPMTIAIAETLDETASAATIVAPAPHYLEAWSDAEPVAGLISFTQPAIAPFFASRSVSESLSVWTGAPKPARDALRAALPASAEPQWFEKQLERGFVETVPAAAAPAVLARSALPAAPPEDASGLTLLLYPKVAIGAGRHAENPWLQELPDPITKVTWDNYASLSPAAAKRLDVEDGDVVRVEAGGEAIELPAHVQPGQHDRAVAIALGYGRAGTERFAEAGPKWLFRRKTLGKGERVGRNAAPFVRLAGGALQYDRGGVTIAKTGRKHPLAATQMHHTLELPEKLAAHAGEKREIVEETTLAAFAADAHAGAAHEHPQANLWSEHAFPVHKWAMAIDLNACTGCSGCVVGCQAENNVPVVGKDEVLRQREMHWIRIDRYYSGGPDEPEVVHQPMLCQHCTNAPCETVCPVVATVHSSEGLNQQVYNRCVGTRYCANNCPYKTRRFNWFDYPHEDRLQNLALNPDVTVRTRGVMEKCSFCVQRIEDAKIEANRLGIRLADGAAKPACQQSCPSSAIVFGDLNDPKSRINALRKDPRHFVVLGELNVQPSVGYMRLVRNREEKEGAHPAEVGGAPQHGTEEKHV
jgi:molybdopterin-containing oxidoreductase family iron-sulfur binding subunit